MLSGGDSEAAREDFTFGAPQPRKSFFSALPGVTEQVCAHTPMWGRLLKAVTVQVWLPVVPYALAA